MQEGKALIMPHRISIAARLFISIPIWTGATQNYSLGHCSQIRNHCTRQISRRQDLYRQGSLIKDQGRYPFTSSSSYQTNYLSRCRFVRHRGRFIIIPTCPMQLVKQTIFHVTELYDLCGRFMITQRCPIPPIKLSIFHRVELSKNTL